jgi:hypothetical protein
MRRRFPARYLNQNMSDNDNEQIAFRNADTLDRRAWIDRALSGVRRRLQLESEPDTAQLPPPAAGGKSPGRPHLYVVRNRASR